MIATDVLQTVFQTSGVSALLNAMQSAQNATQRLGQAQLKYNAAVANGNVSKMTSAWSALQNAVQGVGNAQMQVATVAVNVVTSAFEKLAAAAREAVDAYSDFGKEVMNIRDLTGASAGQSSQAATLFRVAGINDIHAIKEMLHMSSALFSPEGRSALGMIGVSPNTNQTGLALFNQIADGLQHTRNGLLKTQIEEKIFGAKGVDAMLPLLRLTREQRDAVAQLGSAFNEEGLAAVQQFQFATALAGETVMQKVVFPIAKVALPVFEKLAEMVTAAANAFDWLNQHTGGLATWAVVIGGLATSVGLAVVAFSALKDALIAVNAVATVQATIMAVVDALDGNWAAIGAAVAIGGGAIIGLNALSNVGQNDNDSSSPTNKFSDAVDDFSSSVGILKDAFDSIKGKGIPGGMSPYDIGALDRLRALDAIG